MQREDAELKSLILEKVIQNKYDELIEFLKEKHSGLFETKYSILVEIHLQKFIHLVKEDDYQSAIEYATEHIIPALKREDVDVKVQSKAEKVLALLAFKDLNKFPEQDILSSKNIFELTNSQKQKIQNNNNNKETTGGDKKGFRVQYSLCHH